MGGLVYSALPVVGVATRYFGKRSNGRYFSKRGNGRELDEAFEANLVSLGDS